MKRTWRWPLAGFVAGGLAGLTLLTINVVGPAFGTSRESDPRAADRALDVLHTPPLLIQRGDDVEISYDLVCSLEGPEPGRPCSPKGTLYVRGIGESSFEHAELRRGPAKLFRYPVPARLTNGEGFEYYVEFDDGRGHAVTVPDRGPDAPQRTWVVSNFTTVDLGTHAFGATRSPDAELARAGWGNDDRSLGLNSGSQQSRIGPSAFDIAPDGTVAVLDQVNHRLALYRKGRVEHMPIGFLGAEGDVGIAPDGTIWVLDDGGTQTVDPVVLAYDNTGRLVGRADLSEKIGDSLRIGPNGPVVHSYPSEMWLPVGTGHTGLSMDQQALGAEAGRPVADGREVVIRAFPHEARFALVDGDQVLAAWRVRSATNLGEVQLAEPSSDGLTAVVRLWTETQAEFRVLELRAEGLIGSFTVKPAEWAESSSLSRFRLRDGTLYHLWTSPDGARVVAYELGANK